MEHKGSVLVVGAGDATGGAIARRFAREGYMACVTRRNADKLAPLVQRIQAEGGKAHAFGCDARKEEEVVALVARIERDIAPIEVAVFNIGANVRFPSPTPPSACTARSGRWRRWPASSSGARSPRRCCRAGAARSSSPAPPPACAAARASPPLPAPSMRCARWRRAWRANSGRRASTWRTSSSTAPSTPRSSPRTSPQRYALKEQDGILDPDAIAETYWQLHRQPRNAWTHELDLRPWMESF